MAHALTASRSLQRAAAGLLAALLLALPGLPAAYAAEPPLRDPMRAPNAAPATSAATESTPEADTPREAGVPLQLTSIRRAGTAAPRALIDGKWLTVGASVGDWRVRSIGPDSVVLQASGDSGESRRLVLHQLAIRRLGP